MPAANLFWLIAPAVALLVIGTVQFLRGGSNGSGHSSGSDSDHGIER